MFGYTAPPRSALAFKCLSSTINAAGIAALLIAVSSFCAAQIVPMGQKGNPSRIFQLNDLKTAKITVGKRKLTVWVMDSDSKRQEGMMFLSDKEVKPDQGMIFLFSEAKPQGFWMANTLIPLDIAFIDPAGRILNVETMKALDRNTTNSKGAAKFVLEMKKGAFKRLGIKAGMKATIPASVRSVD